MTRIAPVFCVSNVTGHNLELLRKFLNLLPIRTDWEQLYEKPTEFHIDSHFSVPGVGTVVSGTLVSGKISVNQTLLLGPDEFGNFSPAQIKSIQTKRLPVKTVKAGQTAAVALKKVEDVRVHLTVFRLSVLHCGRAWCWWIKLSNPKHAENLKQKSSCCTTPPPLD